MGRQLRTTRDGIARMTSATAPFVWVLLLWLAAAAIPTTGAPSEPPFRGPGWKVSLDVTEAPLRRCLEQLFDQVDSWGVVEPEVPDVPVSVRFHNVSLVSAVFLVYGTVEQRVPGLTIIREADNFIFRLRSPAARAIRPPLSTPPE
jgi:hypothetical protein